MAAVLHASAYQAPRWLPDGHSQTIYPALCLRLPLPAYRREIWPTPDHGQIAVDWLDGPSPHAPLVLLLHGLEGSSHSHYARALMHAVSQRGWQGVVAHFRGCGGLANTLPRAYHAGDSAEVAWILARLAQAGRPLYGVGVSLGGNMLLKHLGEAGASAPLCAAAAVSAPLDLAAAGRMLERGLARQLYTRMFLRTLKPASLATARRHPGLIDVRRAQASRTLREFDDAVTAPLHGFAGVEDYWARASAKPWLRQIARPTLVLNARNDPFLPATALPGPDQASAAVTLEFPAEGGHVGFASGGFPGRLDWLPQRLLDFFAPHVPH